MNKTALVLSGGGFKGAFQVGALEYLQENWNILSPHTDKMKFQIVSGVSVGSLNGLLVASDNFTELQRFWNNVALNGVDEIYTSDFINTKSDSDTLRFKVNAGVLKNIFIPSVDNISLWTKLAILFSKRKRDELLADLANEFKTNFSQFRSIADNTPLKNKLALLAKRAGIKDCIYRCGYVSLEDGMYCSFRHTEFDSDEDFASAILASTAMPIIWPPVDSVNTASGTKRNLVDGGVRNVSPLGDVIGEIKNDPASEYMIIIINCSSGKISPDTFDKKNIAQIALRSLDDIAITEIFNNDLEEFIDKNFILEQVNRIAPGMDILDYDFENRKPGKALRHFKAIIIQPDEGELGDPLVANTGLIKKRWLHGRAKAALALKQFQQSETFTFSIA